MADYTFLIWLRDFEFVTWCRFQSPIKIIQLGADLESIGLLDLEVVSSRTWSNSVNLVI